MSASVPELEVRPTEIRKLCGRKTKRAKGELTLADKKRLGLITKWEPVTWKPEYEAIVGRRIQGYSHKDIATQFNMTSVQICNICTTSQAKAIIAKATGVIRASVFDGLPAMVAVENRLADRMLEVLADDDKFSQSPLAILDMGIKFHEKVTQGIQKISKGIVDGGGGGGNNIINNTQTNVIIGTEQAQRLVDGMRKADEVKVLHEFKK